MVSRSHVLTSIPLLLLYKILLAHSQAYDCVNPINQSGYCLNIRQCPPLLDLLRTYGNQVGDFLRSSVCGYDNADPRVCCPLKSRPAFPTLPPSFDPSIPNTPTVTSAPEIQQSQYGPLFPPNCGLVNTTYTKVVGGQPAQLGAWPWIAALGYTSSNPKKPYWLCGGSLISSRHVLTAAHCAYRRKDLFVVRLGDLDLDPNVADGATPVDILIEKVDVHPEYSATRYTNDIALIRLQQDVQFTKLIQPICLPISDDIFYKDLVRKTPFIAGWGSVYFRGPTSTRLQQLQIPVQDNSRCENAFARFKTAVIDNRIICAGYGNGGKDACQGDSGGPFMYPDQKVWYVVGVISYGFRCAEPGFPGVYSRVTAFLDFIRPLLN